MMWFLHSTCVQAVWDTVSCLCGFMNAMLIVQRCVTSAGCRCRVVRGLMSVWMTGSMSHTWTATRLQMSRPRARYSTHIQYILYMVHSYLCFDMTVPFKIMQWFDACNSRHTWNSFFFIGFDVYGWSWERSIRRRSSKVWASSWLTLRHQYDSYTLGCVTSLIDDTYALSYTSLIFDAHALT